MKPVGVRDFRAYAAKYLAGAEPVAIERLGKLIGFYFPVKPDRDEARKALCRLDATMDEILNRTRMTEDELTEALCQPK